MHASSQNGGFSAYSLVESIASRFNSRIGRKGSESFGIGCCWRDEWYQRISLFWQSAAGVGISSRYRYICIISGQMWIELVQSYLVTSRVLLTERHCIIIQPSHRTRNAALHAHTALLACPSVGRVNLNWEVRSDTFGNNHLPCGRFWGQEVRGQVYQPSQCSDTKCVITVGDTIFKLSHILSSLSVTWRELVQFEGNIN